MPTTYTPASIDNGTYTLPVDGDPANAASFQTPLRQLADTINWVKTDLLPAISQASASIPLLATTSDAEDHPGSASNDWKLILRVPQADGTFVRLYVGNGSAGNFAITVNAVWDPASGAQTWAKDQTGQESNALWSVDGELRWHGKAAGAGSWATASWDATRGDFKVGDTLTAGDDVVAGDQVNAGEDITAGNDVIATHSVKAGAADEFSYSATKTRTTPIHLGKAFGSPFWSAGTAFVTYDGGGHVSFPIDVPVGAKIHVVEIIVYQNSTSPTSAEARRRPTTDWTTPALGTASVIDTDTGPSSVGVFKLSVDFGGVTVTVTDEFWVERDPGDPLDSIYAVRVVDWEDPGYRGQT